MPPGFVGIAAAPVHPAFSEWIAIYEFAGRQMYPA
jgi:hypothetical protein